MRIINLKTYKIKRNTDQEDRFGKKHHEKWHEKRRAKCQEKRPERQRRTGCGKKLVRIGILLLLIISLFVYRDTWREIFAGLRQADLKEKLLSLALAAGGYLMEGMTIFFMMETVISGKSALEGVRIAFICEFYRLATLGNGSGIAEIHYLHRNGIEPGSATVLTMIQYMWKKAAIMILGGLGLAVLWRDRGTRMLLGEYALLVGYGYVGTLAVIGVFFCLVFSGRVADWASAGLRLLAGKLPSKGERILGWERQIRLLNRFGKSVLEQKGRMGGILLCQTGKLLLFYGIPACMLRRGCSIGTPECVALMALAYLLSGVIPAPSGAGGLEFAFLLLFDRFAGFDRALLAVLVFRFATWIMPFAVGGILVAAERAGERRMRKS